MEHLTIVGFDENAFDEPRQNVEILWPEIVDGDTMPIHSKPVILYPLVMRGELYWWYQA